MRFYISKNSTRTININKYLIQWNKPCRSQIQFKVKHFLQPFWERMIVAEEVPLVGSRLTLDIFNATLKIAIEVQGKQHTTYNPFYHRNSSANFLSQIKRDFRKVQFCELNNIKLIEIMEEEVPHLSKQFFNDKFGVIL
jgi:hypothetical protein